MSAWKGLRARLASLRRDSAERRMREEFDFHVAMETRKNLDRGMTPAEARRQANLVFGGMERHSEDMRDGRGMRLLADLRQDLRFAFRGLRRTPVFAAVAIATIALGVGVTTSLFSLANAVLLRRLEIPGAERVQTVQEHRSGAVSQGVEGNRIPWERYLAYRDAAAGVFSDLAAHRTTTVSLRLAGDAQPANAVLMSGEYFRVLQIAPALGRFPTRDDEPVVVLSHALWQAQFAGAADVIGGPAWVDGRMFTIAAVAPEHFHGTVFGIRPGVWVPLEAYAAGRTTTFEQWVAPFGRLRPDVSPSAAAAAMDNLARRLEDADAEVHRVSLEVLGALPGEGRRIAAQFMTMLVGAALLVLMIAAANIAGMLLARALARQREIAVRLSIGAGRFRLVRQLLAESVLLFLLGGGAGVLLAWYLTALVSRVQAPLPGVHIQLSATPDMRVLLFGLAVSVLPALLFGLVPALQATRPDLLPMLRDGSPGSGVRSVRLRSAFVAGQLALAVLLLVTAGLFVRSFRHGLQVDPGFDPAGVVVAAINLAPHGYDEARGRAFYQQLAERLRGQPGVASVALAHRVLLAGESYGTDMRPADAAATDQRVNVRLNAVDTAYFGTLRMALMEGRVFTAADGPGAPDVAVINQTLANRFWPDGNAIGRSLRHGSRDILVVGVLPDGKYVDIGEAPRSFAFLHFEQSYSGQAAIHLRGDLPPADLVANIRREVKALDANIALEYAEPLSVMASITLFPQRFAATLVGALGLLGLLLAAIGVYGVLMYHVAQRSYEFGVRLALGARASDVARSVVARSLRLTAIGVCLGLAAAWFVARLLSGLIFGVSARDPVTFAAVPLILAAFAAAAAWYPAMRAARADPMQVLRSD